MWNRFTPIEKFAAATTPSPAAAASARRRGSCADQPVVPITTGRRRLTYSGKFASSASAVVKSMATSASAHSGRPSSTRPATAIPCSEAS